MSASGKPKPAMASTCFLRQGIDPKTLRKHYREELDTGHVVANAKGAESLFRKATGDGRRCTASCGRRRGCWNWPWRGGRKGELRRCRRPSGTWLRGSAKNFR